ncbi:hypothetical protein BGZ65_000612 [Modicella reniformis]|uniref:Uncharacterized protein n=1 Tax=Modicella reniformis TaxID=1440133 RepID=A0A9P6M122_9FUNG|nr:hypothetical protein BGZ65_000612 [Modicella reniformis]
MRLCRDLPRRGSVKPALEKMEVKKSKKQPKQKIKGHTHLSFEMGSATEEDKDPNTIKKGRKRTPGNLIGDVLNSNFATVTMNEGTIHHRLQRGLQQNYHADDHLELSQHIESTIEGLVKINTDLIRCGSLATLNFINENEIMATRPSIDPTSEDV